MVGSMCVALDAGPGVVTCRPETIAMGDTCVALGIAYYDVRVPVTTIPGDGYSRIPLTLLVRPCVSTPNAPYFDGQCGSYIDSGTLLVTQGRFTASTDTSGGTSPSMEHIGISPGSQAQGLW